MGNPAAKMGDQVVGQDIHIVMVPSPGGPVPTPMAFPFAGIIGDGCCQTVLIEGKPAATAGSAARNTPPHLAPSGQFQVEPTNTAQILPSASRVLIGGKPAARAGDKAQTCNDPAPLPVGTVQAVGTVFIG
ncbi:PAAR motif protein [Lentzea aerocolonigenes]|uniref:PAAR motif protein n=1 Tax=Lentzea aerocolonigenes TaxID=68170 RepID=A0A0F0H0Z7_LENAE|nr:PAAR domain-containing protein [Lentzea aerocolonigenes]KJK49245.1 PAAR motif protein [Lentzea aerocolonigenes]